jgi:transposase-like protein
MEESHTASNHISHATIATGWRGDELFLKVKGNMKYLFVMMDDQTRWLTLKKSQRASSHMPPDTYSK